MFPCPIKASLPSPQGGHFSSKIFRLLRSLKSLTAICASKRVRKKKDEHADHCRPCSPHLRYYSFQSLVHCCPMHSVMFSRPPANLSRPHSSYIPVQYQLHDSTSEYFNRPPFPPLPTEEKFNKCWEIGCLRERFVIVYPRSYSIWVNRVCKPGGGN